MGYTTYTCACGYTYVDNYVDATGHIYEEVVVTDPTCTEAGYTTYTCACGDTYVDNYVDATGHIYEVVVTDPTCTEAGYTTYTCACGDTYVDNYVDATGHNHTAVVTAPTCTDKGYTTYTCTCGDTYVADEVAALGHTLEIIGATAPTCTATGLTAGVRCSVCGEALLAQTVVDALGHTEEIIPAVAPTFNSVGYTEGKKCSVCDEILVAPEEIGVLTDPAVQIGENKYATLQEALAAAQDGDVIELLHDITISNVIIGHSKAVKVTIDLNGYTISSTGSTITVYRQGTEVTLVNGTISGNTTKGTLVVTYGSKAILGEGITIKSGGRADAIELGGGTLEIGEGAKVIGGINCLETQDETANTIMITGGNFSGNIVINEQSACTIIGGTFTTDVSAWLGDGYVAKDNGDGTYTVVEQKVAQIGDKTYSTLEEAIADAKSGDTITLIADVKVDGAVMLTKGITLNLNGKKLTADYLVAFNGNSIIDTDTKTTGLLKVAKGQLALSKDNANIAVYCDNNYGTGYRFAKVGYTSEKFAYTTTEDGFTIKFLPGYNGKFTKNGTYLSNALSTAAGVQNSGIQYIVRLSWIDAENGMEQTQDFVYSPEAIAQFMGGLLTLTVNGVGSYTDLAATIIIKSDTGVESHTPAGVFNPTTTQE